MIVIRWAISMVMAAGITLGLFYFMQFLIFLCYFTYNVLKITDQLLIFTNYFNINL